MFTGQHELISVSFWFFTCYYDTGPETKSASVLCAEFLELRLRRVSRIMTWTIMERWLNGIEHSCRLN